MESPLDGSLTCSIDTTDDAIAYSRFINPLTLLDADGGGDFTTDLGPYTLHSVLATPLCYSHRGVGTDGICN